MTVQSKQLSSPPIQLKIQESFGGVLALLVPAICLLILGLLALINSVTRLMVYDELATWEPATLQTYGKTLSFYMRGLDTPSFLPALLVRASMAVWGDNEFLARVPFICIYLGFCACLYLFVRTRYSEGFALASIFIPAGMHAFWHSGELRSYGMLLLATSAMALFWQQAASPQRRLALCGLWISYSLAILSNVFGLFLFVPFALAELWRGKPQNKFDKSVWIILLTAPFTLLVLVPSILAAHQHYGALFWSKPTIIKLVRTPASFLHTPGIMLFVTILAFSLIARGRKRNQEAAWDANKRQSGFTESEWVLVVSLSLFPIVAYLASLFLGVYVSRYAISEVVGMTLFLVGFAAKLSRCNRMLGYLILFVSLASAVVAQINAFSAIAHGRFGQHLVKYASNLSWFPLACSSDLPIVSSGAQEFLVERHYGPNCLRERFTYLTDPQKATVCSDAMTDEQNMEWFSKLLPLRTMAFDTFTQRHKHFLLIHTPSQDLAFNPEWVVTYLQARKDRYAMKLITRSSTEGFPFADIYDVSVKDRTE